MPPVRSVPLPTECLRMIFQNISNDIHCLHTCILVNRSWCRNAMSYLWARPLSTASKHYKLIQTYISCLEDVDKLLMDEKVVVLPDLPPPLFDYSSYLTEFRYHRLKWAAELWIKIKDELSSSSHNPKAFEITKALSNLLMRKCSKLDTFSIYWEDMPDYTIFSNSPYLSRINKFSCLFSDEYTYRYRESSRNTLDLLQFLPTVCNDIQSLDFRQCDSTAVNRAMKDIILAIPNLQDFKYYGSKDLIYREEIILPALKSQTNNLSSLFLCRVLINDAIYEILSGCVNLETLVISDCKCSFSLISSTKTKFNLKKLHLEFFVSKSIVKSLIQKFANDNLRSLYLNTLFKNTYQTILKICSNIVEFQCNELKFHESSNLFNLLDNLNFLEKLTLTDMVFGDDIGTDQFYNSLGTHLPPTLKYLNIGQLYKPKKIFGIDQFHNLLKNCKASLETIIINQPIEYNDSDFEQIINYTKKTDSLRFLGLDCLRNNHRQRVKELREVFGVFIIPKYDLKNW
ncbi:5644_t:CDS:1 [Funneliformis geosporum]|uniref:16288_t:CDS:1 n=1 Tax=Funneliformis geosporum TaxID=1117311 RepID=A0A9W4SLW1_9GLOM|nr:5644_t:CDS:1 [Funneliformis geosporum]CAI2173169.1 16288_t:CDS:1 [Funneliformis geosporum]